MDWTNKEIHDGAMILLLFLLIQVGILIDPPKWLKRKGSKEGVGRG